MTRSMMSVLACTLASASAFAMSGGRILPVVTPKALPHVVRMQEGPSSEDKLPDALMITREQLEIRNERRALINKALP